MKDFQFCQLLRDKNLTEGCVHCSKDKTGHSEQNKGAQVSSSVETEVTCV